MKHKPKPSCGHAIRIYESQDRRCCYCFSYFSERNPPTWDHIIAKDEGGKDSYDNLCISCLRCNHQKGNIPLDMFLDGYIATYLTGRQQGDDEKESILIPKKVRGPRRWYHYFLTW